MTNFLKLQTEKLDLGEINELIVHESCGGVSFFVGTTRDNFEDKQVGWMDEDDVNRIIIL